MRNDVPLGVLIPNSIWEDLIEDFEAFSSQSYLKRIEEARKSKKRYTSGQVKKMLDL